MITVVEDSISEVHRVSIGVYSYSLEHSDRPKRQGIPLEAPACVILPLLTMGTLLQTRSCYLKCSHCLKTSVSSLGNALKCLLEKFGIPIFTAFNSLQVSRNADPLLLLKIHLNSCLCGDQFLDLKMSATVIECG
jgi:hypothetical protein